MSKFDPDEDLVERIAGGDEVAVRELMERHVDWIMGCGFRLLGSREDAEEVVQEVFLRVWRAAPKWQPGEAKFRTWMNRVTVNLCFDRLRKKREVVTDDLPEIADERGTPADQLQECQTVSRVQGAIDRLPERQKTAIILCHHQGLSNIEAADLMGVSVEALESLLARGRRKLKALLAPELEQLLA